MSKLSVDPAAKALIFDLDGTLADTMPTHLSAWLSTAHHFGAPLTAEMFQGLVGMASSKIVAELNHRFDLNLDAAAVSKKKAEFFFSFQKEKIKPIPEVFEIAKKYRGVLPMAVGTGGRSANAERILKDLGILDWFDALVCADHVENHKPHPDTFLRCAELLYVDPRSCQVFEDADFGVKAGEAAGMMVTDIRKFL